MFHASFMTIPTCFIHTLCHYYAFSGTNLLNEMPKCQFLFSAVFGFRNPSNEIFSESDEINAQVPIFPGTIQNTREPPEGSPGGPTPHPGAARGGAAPPYSVAPPWPLFVSPSNFWKLRGKIGPWALISSNSENISLLGFLKPKTAENSNWPFGISSIG